MVSKVVENEISLQKFHELFDNNLPTFCLPEFFAEIVQGWTQETLKQVNMTLTKKGTMPLTLWFDSVDQMRPITNKREHLIQLFKWLDYRNFNRIDTLVLFAITLVAIDGKPEQLSNNIMLFFGFSSEETFHRDEFHFFLDCLFKGLLALTINGKNKQPLHRGWFVTQVDIEKLVSKVFLD